MCWSCIRYAAPLTRLAVHLTCTFWQFLIHLKKCKFFLKILIYCYKTIVMVNNYSTRVSIILYTKIFIQKIKIFRHQHDWCHKKKTFLVHVVCLSLTIYPLLLEVDLMFDKMWIIFCHFQYKQKIWFQCKFFINIL